MQLRVWTPGVHLLLHSMGCGAEALLELLLSLIYSKPCQRHMRLCHPRPYLSQTGASSQAAAATLPLSMPFIQLQTAQKFHWHYCFPAVLI